MSRSRIADLDGSRARLPDRATVGELWSRSPANALGYFKQPEVTAERFTADGWLLTGDLMRAGRSGVSAISAAARTT